MIPLLNQLLPLSVTQAGISGLIAQNQVVVAGAGSGKTRVLVRRYLELLVHNDWQLNQLVAITFTQKAAQEMRDRVRLTLTAMAYTSGDLRWYALLRQMDSARIDTIHALCAAILRVNAAPAGIDPQFAVLDDVQAGMLRDQAVEDTLRHLVAERSPMLELLDAYTIKQVKTTLSAYLGQSPEIKAPDEDLRLRRLTEHWVAVIARANAAYRDLKTDRAALDFDDLEIRTRDLLVDHPDVRQRYLDGEFQHLLVDEFQDTNPVQWQIVSALAPPEQQGRLFLVGDPKQSIYAFRGADIAAFQEARRAIRAAGGAEKPMSNSFRAHRSLTDCFNHVFRVIMHGGSDYAVQFEDSVDAMIAERADAPCPQPPVELILLRADLEDPSINTERGRVWEARTLARRIRQLVEVEKRPIYDKEARQIRPVRYGDVAMLFRAMSNVDLYEAALRSEGVPYLTIAGKGFYERQEVWDVKSLLNALYMPSDELSLASTLRSPMFGLSDDALYGLRLHVDADGRPVPLWDALADADHVPADEQPLVRHASQVLNQLRALAGRVQVAELLHVAFEMTGYLAVLTGLPDGARRRANLEKLVEIARASRTVTLSDFTQYLKDVTAREVREGEAVLDAGDAVTLMTIHKSKGLEFPLVILADASRQSAGGESLPLLNDPKLGCGARVKGDNDKFQDSAQFKLINLQAKAREEAENRRLLYVAMTRAQDHLIISGQISRKQQKKKDVVTDLGWTSRGEWLKWLLDAFDITTIDGADTVVAQDWGQLALTFPADPPDDAATAHADPAFTAWPPPDPHIPSGAPPGLEPVRIERDAPARSLSATHIADLGTAITTGEPEKTIYTQRWRRAVLHDAPHLITSISATKEASFERIIGDMVHRALQWQPQWRSQPPEVLQKLLDRYAWEAGIIQDSVRERAVGQAASLMENVLLSDVQAWIDDAQRVLREVPFMYRTEKRVIYGVIDALIQQRDGTWLLVDYKTTRAGNLPDHARRYYLQIGVYAAAARQFLNVDDVRVYIHYIRSGTTISVAAEAWEGALRDLEPCIGQLVDMDDG